MSRCAEDLLAHGLGVVRFNFPYMQMRVDELSRRPPDRAPVLLDVWRAMLDRLATMGPARRQAGPSISRMFGFRSSLCPGRVTPSPVSNAWSRSWPGWIGQNCS